MKFVDVIERRFVEPEMEDEMWLGAAPRPASRELWDRMSREEKVETIERLYDPEHGMTFKKIGALFGVGGTTINSIRTDPDGSRRNARRRKSSGVCVDCGGRTFGEGTKTRSTRCSSCSHAIQAAAKYWTDERVVEAIHAWVAVLGRRPGAQEWLTVNRADSLAWPNTTGVAQRFGSFGLGIAAAGFPRPGPGDRMAPGWRRARKAFTGGTTMDYSRDSELAELIRKAKAEMTAKPLPG